MSRIFALESWGLACAIGTALAALPSASAQADTANIEVVQSVPVETTLAVPGLRMAQEVWLEMIQAARTQIDFEQFYVSDQAGQELAPVLDAIVQASQRGVHIRFIVDAGFYKTYPDSVNRLSTQAGIETKTVDFSNLGGIQHAKYFVIDGQQVFEGSQNFDWRALNQIHEIGFRINDTRVASDLESVFQTDWTAGVSIGTPTSTAGPETIPAGLPTDSSLQTVASPDVSNPSGVPATLKALTDLMGSAKSSIRIQVMEYTTSVYGSSSHWTALDDVVRQAAARGVQVQLMVDISDLKKAKADLQGLAKLKNVQVRLVTIPPWSGGAIPYARLIHSKYLIVDGAVSWVGSENWSEGYFTNTRNAGVISRSTDIASTLGQVFNLVWTSSYTSQP